MSKFRWKSAIQHRSTTQNNGHMQSHRNLLVLYSSKNHLLRTKVTSQQQMPCRTVHTSVVQCQQHFIFFLHHHKFHLLQTRSVSISIIHYMYVLFFLCTTCSCGFQQCTVWTRRLVARQPCIWTGPHMSRIPHAVSLGQVFGLLAWPSPLLVENQLIVTYEDSVTWPALEVLCAVDRPIVFSCEKKMQKNQTSFSNTFTK